MFHFVPLFRHTILTKSSFALFPQHYTLQPKAEAHMAAHQRFV